LILVVRKSYLYERLVKRTLFFATVSKAGVLTQLHPYALKCFHEASSAMAKSMLGCLLVFCAIALAEKVNSIRTDKCFLIGLNKVINN
jgi:hypothetical protein